MPDYIGYGITVSRVHPYLQAQLAAQNSIDRKTDGNVNNSINFHRDDSGVKSPVS